jgi:DUF917 family protein
MKKLTFEEVKDILVGCTILSTGGGGDLKKGLNLIKEDWENNLEYKLISLEEIEDEALFASPYFCGSIGKEEKKDNYSKYTKINTLPTVAAVQALERYFQEEFSGMVSIEYGGMNTAVAMSTAARLNKFIVDADAAGRAVPDLQFSTFYVSKKSITPLAVADDVGDIAVFVQVVDDFRAEDLVRSLSVVSGGMVGMVDHPLRGKELRKAVIPGALSYAQMVGKAQRQALKEEKDPIKEIIKAVKGYLLFDGMVKKDTEWENKGGFTLGSIEIEGKENFTGQNFKIWFKNENIISWRNEEILVTVPDLICVVETATGYPLTNPFCKKDMQVSVLGFKAPSVWRTERGLSILNPRFFGFDIPYIPIEEKLK